MTMLLVGLLLGCGWGDGTSAEDKDEQVVSSTLLDGSMSLAMVLSMVLLAMACTILSEASVAVG